MIPLTCAIFHSRIMKYQENKAEQDNMLGKAPKAKGGPQQTDFEVQLQTKLRSIGALDANLDPVPVKIKNK